ncbi:MAG: hypothetical protein H7Z73_10915 [Candidatus Saccharibacteria bacterium]|nr:hypothetical protein [Moraxellaceae bacterium]
MTGCGGGSSSSSNNNNNNPPTAACSINSAATDLQKAKDFVTSFNAIISNTQKTFETYKPTNLAGTEELGAAAGAIVQVIDAANTKSAALTTAEIQSALESDGAQNKFTNVSGLTATVSAGTVTVSGSFTIQVQTGYAFPSGVYTPTYGSPVTVNVSKFVTKIPTGSTTGASYNAQLNADSAISVTTASNQTTTLKAGANSTFDVTYPTSDTLNNNIDNAIPNSGKINFANISVTSGDTKLSLDQFALLGKKVKYTTGTSTVVQTSFVPTSITFKGSASQGVNTAGIDATINLTNDLSGVIALDANGSETSTNFVKGNFTLNLTTTITVGAQTNVFTAKFAGNRAAYNAAQISNIELSSNCDKITGTADFTAATAAQPETVKVVLNHPNGASTTINNILSVGDAPAGTKVSDITVNGTVQGSIFKSTNSVYQASFPEAAGGTMTIVIAN